VTGFKPSTGRVPTTGAFPLSMSFDSVGPLANSVACCAAAHAIMSGEGEGAIVRREVSGLRLAVLKDFVLDGLEAPVAAAFDRAFAKLGKAGASLADLNFPELKDIPSINSKGGIVAAEAYYVHRERL